ncbi:MAG: glycosyltransferase [Myxococcales bacterium]|nr:glycosyltransferase [Myxococcales bacterium]
MTLPDSPNFLVFLPTFNRPRMAAALLRELLAQAAGRRVHIQIYDDGSYCDYGEVLALVAAHPDRVAYRRGDNRGRAGLWQTYNEVLEEARRSQPDYLVFLQDHSAIADGFFERLDRAWRDIPDADKTVVNLPREPRTYLRWWSSVTLNIQQFAATEILTSGWVDGSWFAGPKLWQLPLTPLEPDPPVIPPEIACRGPYPLIQLSEKILAAGGNLYTLLAPLLAPRLLPEPNPAARTVRVCITTYNRPANLALLLRQIAAEAADWEVRVDIYDDASTADYSAVRALVDSFGGRCRLFQAEKNLGKRGYWKTYHRILRSLADVPEEYFVFLQDDVEICDDFFDVILDCWRAVPERRKIALNLQVDNWGNDHRWTRKKCPVQTAGGRSFLLSGWFDGFWFGTKATLEVLSYAVYAIDPQRWIDDPRMSSGVFQQITGRLTTVGYNIYRPAQSLVRVIPSPSVMNSDVRDGFPIHEVNFRGRAHPPKGDDY